MWFCGILKGKFVLGLKDIENYTVDSDPIVYKRRLHGAAYIRMKEGLLVC